MNWHFSLGGFIATNSNDQRLGGSAELSHCDRTAPVCVDKGFGLQVAVGTMQTPIVDRSGATPVVRDSEFIGLAYFGRLGLLFNPASSVGLGPVLRAGVSHNFGQVDAISHNGVNSQNFTNAGPFFSAGIQLLLTGKVFGISGEAGVASHPSVPLQDRTAGFYGQVGGRIQF